MHATPSSARRTSAPLRLRAALLLLLGVIAFMALSAWLAHPGWERAFRSDASPVAWLSSALLLTLAVLSLRLWAEAVLPRGPGAWLALAMFALALDEQFMLHELWKYRCHELSAWCEADWVRELPMRAVAVLGAITVALLARALPGRLTRGLLLAGLACGLWALLIDQWPMPYPIAQLEEAFEVLAEALLLAALLSLPARPAT